MGGLFKNWDAKINDNADFEAKTGVDALVSTAVFSDVYRTLQFTEGDKAVRKLAPLQAAFPGKRPKKVGWLDDHLAQRTSYAAEKSALKN